MQDVVSIIHRNLDMADTSWSIGSFGAIAEFHREQGEPVEIAKSQTGGHAISEKGGVGIVLKDEAVTAPYETLSRKQNCWMHGVNFCLPPRRATMAYRKTLEVLGPDHSALRKQDRDAVLFDLGLDLPHVDACIRTHDASLIDALKEQTGKPLFTPGGLAMRMIKEASPHRVFMSQFGRVEVYQRIGSNAQNIPTPDGPHTHILPKLLAHKRTHAANVPVPGDCIPCLTMYPPNPVMDDHGHVRPFDQKAHTAFQEMLLRYGEPELIEVKRRTIEAVMCGDGPPNSLLEKHKRTALRIALRQMHWTDRTARGLQSWQDAFEHGSLRDEVALGDAH